MKNILLLAEHDYQVKDFLNKGLGDVNGLPLGLRQCIILKR